MKLAAKLTVLFLLLSVIPLGVAGYLAYDNGRRALEQDTVSRLISTTILRKAELDRWIKGSEWQLRMLARAPLIREYAAVLTSHDPADPRYQAAHRSMLEDHLSLNVEEGSFLDLSILRPGDGLILVSTNRQLEGKYWESEPFFVEGESRTYVQNFNNCLALQKPIMHISTPVKDKEGNLIAVLASHLDMAEMSKIMMQQSGLSATEETYLVSKFNIFVTESRFEPGYALKKAVRTEGVEACLSHNDGVHFYENYRGVPVIGAYRWLPDRELCILTEVDQAEAFAHIVAWRNAILGIGLAVALIVTLLGIFFARTITGPASQLVKGAEEIGRGNLNYEIQVKGRDEIGQLASSFNRMTRNLKELQERLVGAEKLAVLGQLAGCVAHELRNPLGVISNAVYYLKMVLPDADKTTKECMEMITTEVRSSEKIISDLLDLSRTRPPEREWAVVSELIAQVLKRQSPPGKVQVSREIASDLPPVFVDPQQVRQVLENLVSNAYQAMPEGGKLTIQANAEEDNLLVAITDTGCGISQENKKKLFEPLFTTKARGIGFGLAVSNSLVQANGGKIEVASEEGRGSTFTVVLPTWEVQS